MLEDLFTIQNRIISLTPVTFKRFLYNKINWDNRLIALIGPRGAGKTTLVLQHYLEKYNDTTKCLYISADNPLVLKEGIYNTATEYLKYYGECVIIDEVHKQVNWSIDIKALYDSFPDKKFIILGSSALNILGQKGDLSRRVVIYRLPHLSFREYLLLKLKKKYQPVAFHTLLDSHLDLSRKIIKDISHILTVFQDYLTAGNFPFCIQYSRDEYFNIVSNIIDKVIYEDIPNISAIKPSSSFKIKKLLGHIAFSRIPLFNVESLKTKIEVSKEKLYDYFDLLERAQLLTIIRTRSRNIRAIKNSKILFKSPNFYFTIAYNLWKHDLEKGNIRESFFASQVVENYRLHTSKDVDFAVEDNKGNIYEVEVGGKSKSKKQLQNAGNVYIFKDGIEMGYKNSIPLYLTGFLY